MEIEADQFAAYVLNHAGMRPEATLDMIVRLHRGDVPAPVRRGDGWAGLLRTHPADDYRLAAMRSTLGKIQGGATRPVSKSELIARHTQLAARLQNGYMPTVLSRSGKCAWINEHPNCKWWGGKNDGVLWPLQLPVPFRVCRSAW